MRRNKNDFGSFKLISFFFLSAFFNYSTMGISVLISINYSYLKTHDAAIDVQQKGL